MIPSITPPSASVVRCPRCGRESCSEHRCDSTPPDEPADTGTMPWHRDATQKDRLR